MPKILTIQCTELNIQIKQENVDFAIALNFKI